MTAALPMIMPTLPGKVNGIISDNPWTLQCQDCGATVTCDDLGRRRDRIAILVILSGYHFHVCQHQQPPIRRCPECLRASRLACPAEHCRTAARRNPRARNEDRHE